MKTIANINNKKTVNRNMSEPVSSFAISSVVTHGVLALFGAFAHAINAHRSGQTKGFFDFVALMVLSSFSGVIFALLALHTFDSEYITLAAAGSGGFLGIEGITFLAPKVRNLVANFLTTK